MTTSVYGFTFFNEDEDGAARTGAEIFTQEDARDLRLAQQLNTFNKDNDLGYDEFEADGDFDEVILELAEEVGIYVVPFNGEV